MSALAIILCVLCQFFLIAGQLFLKHAMHPASPRPRTALMRSFAAGVGCLTAWFFLWVGLLQQLDLSQVYPFEGLNPALMVVGAWALLRERVPGLAWGGVGLIAAGVALVSGS